MCDLENTHDRHPIVSILIKLCSFHLLKFLICSQFYLSSMRKWSMNGLSLWNSIKPLKAFSYTETDPRDLLAFQRVKTILFYAKFHRVRKVFAFILQTCNLSSDQLVVYQVPSMHLIIGPLGGIRASQCSTTEWVPILFITLAAGQRKWGPL